MPLRSTLALESQFYHLSNGYNDTLITSHVVKRSIKIIYVKVLSKRNNAMQMCVIIVVLLARYLLFNILPGSMSLVKLLQGTKETNRE